MIRLVQLNHLTTLHIKKQQVSIYQQSAYYLIDSQYTGQLSLKPPSTSRPQESTTSSVQYDYCTVPEVNGSTNTQLDERVYATVENGESNYHSVDYTTVYDDPTSLSYVVSDNNSLCISTRCVSRSIIILKLFHTVRGVFKWKCV